MRHFLFFLVLIFAISNQGHTQDTKPGGKEAEYAKVIDQRAEKIVTGLAISDPSKFTRVKNIIIAQYHHLSDIQNVRDSKIKAAKEASADKESVKVQVKAIEEDAGSQVEKLHSVYLSALSKELTSQQVDAVKDGMTYKVVPITYKGYLDMIPNLTSEQKNKIMAWLVEAREHAMDAESSDKKHAWFGKYKGRINNFLSTAGYDLKKEGEEWEKRRKATASGSPSNSQ